jgi:quercetin 2,3-dioxygenase
MIQQTEGLILLAEKRQQYQTDTFRSLATLPNQDNQKLIAEKFENFIKFSDNTLAPQKSCTILSDDKNCVVLIPLVGALEINDRIVDAGEIAYLFVGENEAIMIQNPYESEFINFVEIWFKTPQNKESAQYFDTFDLEANQNSLIELKNENLPNHIFIGKFIGKKDGEINLRENKAFAINITGSIEVQERLLFERDAVMVWDCDEISFESLANESILLLITG